MNILDFQRTYYEARTEYDNAKAESDRLEKLWRAEEAKLIDAMMDEGVKSVTLDDGSRPTLAKTVSIKCNKDTHDRVREWLRDTVGDDSDFIETLPNRHKVAAHVKKCIEEEGLASSDFPGFLAVSVKPTMRVLGWKNRKSEPPKYIP